MLNRLLNKIKSSLEPPTFGDEEKDRVARMLNIVLLALLAASVLSAITNWMVGYYTVVVVVLLGIIPTLIAYWLMRHGHFTQASILELGLMLLITMVLLLYGNGVNDIAIILYPLIIVLSSLLLTTKITFVFLLVIIGSSGLVVTLKTPAYENALNDFLVLTVLLTIITVMMQLLSRDLTQTIRKSKDQEEHLKDINFQLQQQSEITQLSEARWRSLVENVPDGILRLNREGIIQSVNSPDLNYLLNKNGFDFLLPDGKEKLALALEAVFDNKEPVPFEAQGINPQEDIRWYALRFGPVIQDGKVTSATLIARDITTNKEAEAALVESEEMYRSVVENSLAGIFIVDSSYRYSYVNGEMCKLLGYSQQELIRRDFRTVLTEESLAITEDRYVRRQRGEELPSRYEISVYRKDGERREMELTAAVVKDAGGVPRTMGQMIDITERKRAEEAMHKYAEELVRSNRELQNFAYVASHDLQEPLRKIQAFSSRLQSKESAGLSEQGTNYLVRIEKAAARMQTLIKDLLNFSRVTTHAKPFQTVNLSETIDGVLSDIEVQIQTTSAQIEIDALPTIEADPIQMRQLFQNLISNALKFHNNGQAPVVTVTCNINIDENSTSIQVADNGIGFEEKYLDRIFTVFQRLHNRTEFEGTGVGLAVCRRVVERHNGTITAKSTPGQGATFIITLPLQQASSDK